MLYWGRFIGAVFGYLLAGPIGILLGLFVGTAFDRGYGNNFRSIFSTDQHRIQQVYFKVTFQVMGHVAKADGRISEDEIKAARSIMQRMNLNQQQTMQAIQYFTEGKQPQFNLQAALDQLMQTCHNHRVLLQMFIEFQFQAAQVDGLNDPNKIQMMQIISQRLGFSPIFNRYYSAFKGGSRRHHQRRAKPTAPRIDDDYSLLEIAKTASHSEIKRAYRKMMSQNHPDKLVSQGLPEEMIKLANEKTQKIRAAYERIKLARGF